VLAVSASRRPDSSDSAPCGTRCRPASVNSRPTWACEPAQNSVAEPPWNVSRPVALAGTVIREPSSRYRRSPSARVTVRPSTVAVIVPRSEVSSARLVGISAQAGPGAKFTAVSSSESRSSNRTSHHIRRSNRRSTSGSSVPSGGPGGTASGG
jgi:hypothetical protein